MTRTWRWLTISWEVYGLVWIGLEGDLRRVIVLGVVSALVAIGNWQRRLPLQATRSAVRIVGQTAVSGLAVGAGSVFFTLLLMAIKTGLHGHGPEFTPQELAWVWRQLPLWTAVGGIAGSGVGLLRIAFRYGSNQAATQD